MKPSCDFFVPLKTDLSSKGSKDSVGPRPLKVRMQGGCTSGGQAGLDIMQKYPNIYTILEANVKRPFLVDSKLGFIRQAIGTFCIGIKYHIQKGVPLQLVSNGNPSEKSKVSFVVDDLAHFRRDLTSLQIDQNKLRISPLNGSQIQMMDDDAVSMIGTLSRVLVDESLKEALPVLDEHMKRQSAIDAQVKAAIRDLNDFRGKLSHLIHSIPVKYPVSFGGGPAVPLFMAPAGATFHPTPMPFAARHPHHPLPQIGFPLMTGRGPILPTTLPWYRPP